MGLCYDLVRREGAPHRRGGPDTKGIDCWLAYDIIRELKIVGFLSRTSAIAPTITLRNLRSPGKRKGRSRQYVTRQDGRPWLIPISWRTISGGGRLKLSSVLKKAERGFKRKTISKKDE